MGQGIHLDPQMTDGGRGNTIPLSQEWLDMLHGLWRDVKEGRHPKSDGQTVSMDTFGAWLAEAIGRDRPYSRASISRFLAGLQVSDDLSDAFCLFFGLNSPALYADTPAEIDWFNLGRRLRGKSQTEYDTIVAMIRSRLSRL